MKTVRVVYFVVLVFSVLELSACSSGQPAQTPAQSSGGQIEPPAEYAGKTMPNNSDAKAGEEAFLIYCASCHGEKGLGDGAAASSLNPAPENLAKNQKDMSDAYIFWRIAEGGMMEPFKSAMPSWKGILSEEQIWNVVSFLRSLTG